MKSNVTQDMSLGELVLLLNGPFGLSFNGSFEPSVDEPLGPSFKQYFLTRYHCLWEGHDNPLILVDVL